MWCSLSPTGEIRLDRKLRRYVTGNLVLKLNSYILLILSDSVNHSGLKYFIC